MTEKEFTNRIMNGRRDLLQEFLDSLGRSGTPYCLIGGVAVNAYAEPVVSLDLDVVIASQNQDQLIASLPKEYTVRNEKHSINIAAPFSDLRIQLQTDARYQAFIAQAVKRKVLGYEVLVASLECVLQGKLWAYGDTERRPSKRQKDLADIMRLMESNQQLASTSVGQAAKEIISRI